MPRSRRSRVNRQVAVLAAFLALLGLLELNRVLPGGWPGGGGEGGFRPWPSPTEDDARLRPPDDQPPSWPREGVVVALLGAGGRPPDEAEVAADAATADATGVDAEGRAQLTDARTVDHGFVVHYAGGALRHGPADPAEASTWTVHLPDDLPRVADPAEELALVLVTVRAENAAPLAGVVVRAVGPGVRDVVFRSGVDGRVALPRLLGRTRLEVEAAGRRPRSVWVHPAQADREPRVHLFRSLPATLRIVDAEDGTPVAGTRLRLRSAAGDVYWERETGPAGPSGLNDWAGASDLHGAVLEVWSPTHPVVQVPVADLGAEIRLERGRLFEVDVRDARSQRLPGVGISARYAPLLLGDGGPPGAEPIEVDVEGGPAGLVLPSDRPVRVLIEAEHSAPRAVDVAPSDEGERRIVKLEVGERRHVRVVDAEGGVVEGALVIAVASADGLPVRRRTRTAADGTATLAALPAGAIEIYAHAKDMAWAAAVSESTADDESVVLQLVPGFALRVVVEDGMGLPLTGVRVHAWPEAADALADVVPPGSVRQRTGPEGTLVIPDLPKRSYRIRFSKPGCREVVLHDVAPGEGVHFVTLLPRDG